MLFMGYVDVTSNTQMIGLAAASIAIPNVNEPPRGPDLERARTEPTLVYIQMSWEGVPDLDFWVTCSNWANGRDENKVIVGYQNRHSGYMDLAWDDLGGKEGEVNFERVTNNSQVARMPPNAHCQINMHAYSLHAAPLPVDGKLVIILNKDAPTELSVTPREGLPFRVTAVGQEITLAKLAWSKEGDYLADGSELYPSVPTKCIATQCKG